jgi:hypothetical protein
MQINKVTRKVRLETRLDSIKYQLITELVFLRKMQLIDSDLTYLSYLTVMGPMPLKDFCHQMVLVLHGPDVTMDPNKYPVRLQTVRNRLNTLEKKGLVLKQGKGKKQIMLNPAIGIEISGSVLLDYNFIYIETKEGKGLDSQIGERVAAL